jgi:hypothetical protein
MPVCNHSSYIGHLFAPTIESVVGTPRSNHKSFQVIRWLTPAGNLHQWFQWILAIWMNPSRFTLPPSIFTFIPRRQSLSSSIYIAGFVAGKLLQYFLRET